MEENIISFKRKASKVGGSLKLTIPPELVDFLEVKEDSEISLKAYIGSKGKFVAIWKN